MNKTFLHFGVSALSLFIVAHLVPGIQITNLLSLLIGALVLGFVNTYIRPIVQMLALPLSIASLGIFAIIVNAVLLEVVSAIVPGFHIHGFFAAFIGTILLSIVNSFLHGLIKK